MAETITGDVKLIERLLARGAERAPAQLMPNGGTALVVPPGYSVKEMPPLEPLLPRIRQSVLMHDQTSFIAYVNRFKTPATQLFVEPGFLASGKAMIGAAVDYHEPGRPDHMAHRVAYAPRYSEQWQRWQAICGKLLKQVDFAELIEEARGDITAPLAAQLLDIVRAFKASKKVEFDSVVYQPNGDVRLVYDERTEQTGTSGLLPEKLAIGIPVYYRGSAYAIDVWVRYKVDGGAVKFTLKIDRADVVEDVAFEELTRAIGAAVGIVPYLGRV